MKHICKTCRHAQWQRTPKGNIRTSMAGECTYILKMQSLPICARVALSRYGIWSTSATECPTWEKKP